jgi:hypothetical protein
MPRALTRSSWPETASIPPIPRWFVPPRAAFFTFPWEGSALQAEFKGQNKFVPITYKKDWNVIRKIDAASGVKYTCK